MKGLFNLHQSKHRRVLLKKDSNLNHLILLFIYFKAIALYHSLISAAFLYHKHLST